MKRAIGVAIAALLVVAAASIGLGSAASINVTSRKLTQFTAPGPTTSTTTPGDTTPPALTTLELRDPGNDGVAEIVEATFNEPIACEGGSCATARWGITGSVPSGGSLTSVTVSGSKATLTFTGSTKNTAVGTLAISLSSTTAGGRILDAAGNKASFASTSPADKARPVPVTIATTNGNGRTETADTLTVTFSETISSAGYPKTVAVRIEDPEGNANDLLTIAEMTDGALDTGSNGYQGQNNDYHEFGSSQLTVSGATVTATVAGTCSNRNKGCSNIGTGVGTFTFRPSTSISDGAGNTATGSITTTSAFRIF